MFRSLKVLFQSPVLVSIFTTIVTSGVIQYFSLIWPIEDLSIFYRGKNLDQIGETDFGVAFSILNRGRQSALIEELGLVQIVGKNIELEICTNKSIPDFIAGQLLFIGNRGHIQKLGNDMEMSYVSPREIFIDNVQAFSAAVAVDEGKLRKLDMVFRLSAKYDYQRSIGLCPTIHFFDNSGKSFLAVCEGWLKSPAIPPNTGFNIAEVSRAMRLLPIKGSFLDFALGHHQNARCSTTDSS